MAGVSDWQADDASAARHLGRLERAQYAALMRMRWRLIANGLRSIHGILDLGATGITLIIYTFMGVGLGVGMGCAAYLLASREEWGFVPILFWALLVIWQMMPIAMASFQEQFDLGILLRFPVRFDTYFVLYLLFGLTDASTIQGGLCCLGIWLGVAVARPGLLLWTTVALAAFAAFNAMLARAIFVWIDRWLAQRKTREILGAMFMVLVLALQLLNPALYQDRHRNGETAAQRHKARQVSNEELKERYVPLLRKADAVQRWLPPGLAAQAVGEGAEDRVPAGLGSLGILGLYALAAGTVLAVRLKAEYRGENLSSAPARAKTAAIRNAKTRETEAAGEIGAKGFGAVFGAGPLPALIEKEVRSLLRTLPYLYAIGAPLLLMLVFSSVFIHSSNAQGRVFPLALPICMVYSQLGFTQLFYNNLGAEGAGIQLYFLSPTPFRTVMLAKNLLHAALFFAVAMVAGLLAVLRLGVPDGAVLAGTAAWLVFSLPLNLSAGNIFSMKMAYRVNPGRISRQPGSQANALLSLLVQFGVLVLGAAVFAPCLLFHRLWLAAPIFLLLSLGSLVVWLRVLGNADAMANSNKDELLTTISKAG